MEPKTRVQDKWLYYKIIVGCLILSFLLTIYIFHMVNQTWLKGVQFPFSRAFFQWQFFSFFTYQSNFIVAIFLLLSAIHHKNANHFIHNQNLRIAITCYITVTMITWTFFLLPGILISKRAINPWSLIQGVVLHIVFPIAMIIFAFKHLEPFSNTVRSYYSKSFWIYLIYPIMYTLMLGAGFFSLLLNTDLPPDIIFPYAPVFAPATGIEDIIDSLVDTTLAIIGVFILSFTFFILSNVFYLFVMNRLLKSGC